MKRWILLFFLLSIMSAVADHGKGWTELEPVQPPSDETVQQFRGTLRHVPDPNEISFVMRYNPYKLELEPGVTQDVHYHGDDLKKLVGKKVVFEGYRVQMEVEGQNFDEIWPLRVKLAE
ncbi:MAG: hypothetical protein HY319_14900 [Armatimonadetes bacterium]|nr:hypothetical protein [Armatimonadota bacterium]